MNAKRNEHGKVDAFTAGDQEYADAIRLVQVLEYKLEERRCKIAHDPRNWGHVGDAAHVRTKLEELLVNFYPEIDQQYATEEEAHREVRRQAGIAVERSWS